MTTEKAPEPPVSVMVTLGKMLVCVPVPSSLNWLTVTPVVAVMVLVAVLEPRASQMLL